MKKRFSGFTLIEVMTAVAIVAVLAAIAVPPYRDYVMRGQIQEGTTFLSDGRVKMEQFFQDNRTYADVGTIVAPCPGATKYFTYGCAHDATTFKITATGKDSLNGFIYTINQAAAQTSKSTWTGGAEVNCWIVKKGGTCPSGS